MKRVCLDERKGRRAALAVGLKVTGTLGLLVYAKSSGLITELRPVLEKMTNTGAFFNKELIRRILEGVGEGQMGD